jgi:S1-C subfamily serine protease
MTATLRKRFRERTLAATVRLSNLGGQGVLVPGGFILTATHCIEWNGDGRMALGDYFVEKLETQDGRKLLASVYAAEPVTDMAVLGAMDNQEAAEHSLAFDRFTEEVPGVPVFFGLMPYGEAIPAYVLSHKKEWIAATVTRYGTPREPHGTLCLAAPAGIECGTSGGPVVNKDGRLLGVISHGTDAGREKGTDEFLPSPSMALPRWIADRIKSAQKLAEGAGVEVERGTRGR